ncbi:hypothetical protein [Parabacteroides sp. FAFU027]|uniref:alpha-d-galacturonidase n=1 Tax=Parabacteroides sp. FAFU027 TaxID=2922715 RepID=UPI001FAF4A4D|nr:hypothetical protein [Parabacteroides sp. FAFU027]
MRKLLVYLPFLYLLFCSFSIEKVTIVADTAKSKRVGFGVERLKESLASAGFQVRISAKADSKRVIAVGEWDDLTTGKLAQKSKLSFDKKPAKEGFAIKSADGVTIIKGADASGVLYGCLELADRIKKDKKLPASLNITDQPEMVMRGACIGVQKTVYLPGHDVYEYPYTPENFPWFYDKALWIKYLDMLVDNRMNSLYLWNGHPFASLVKLKDYPFAVEVDDKTFAKNEEMFKFLTEEAEKRGIWVIQMFYNIIVSKPFADHYGIKTQDRSRPITPLIADYTQKSIAAFIEKYPHVGLLVCLGEAMDTYEDDVNWFCKTIIPGVKDGLKALGTKDLPPIVVRAHDTDLSMVMKEALPLYSNLYSMHKYNGESLTTYEPRGPWAKIHKDLSALGSVHISNVHILANLEPFRYGSPDFIQKSVSAMHNIHGANAIHIYPQASYWDWPYSADKAPNRLLEMDRDWMWYQGWARYAWNDHRDRKDEINYWSNKLCDFYGCAQGGENILAAYEQTGEIAPKLLRRFGITEGNRQTLLLGMLMSQLVNPYKYKIYPGFYESCGPEGEKLIEWAEKENKHQPHIGELPFDVTNDVVKRGKLAVESIEKATPFVTKNKDEFNRLKNDVYCYNEFANFFADKVKAAALILEYGYTKNIALLDQAVPFLESSLSHYKKLVDLTKDTYLYANSMQTKQRRVPVGGDDGKNKTWAELYPYYQTEYNNLKKNIVMLKANNGVKKATEIVPLKPATVKILSKDFVQYPLSGGKIVYSDTTFSIKTIAPELKKLNALKTSFKSQNNLPTEIQFTCDKPVYVLVGFLTGNDRGFLKAPTLETDASANDYGQAEPKLMNALNIPTLAPVNIHSYYFKAGNNTLRLGKGAALLLGFIDGEQKMPNRDAGLTSAGQTESVDWLFY